MQLLINCSFESVEVSCTKRYIETYFKFFNADNFSSAVDRNSFKMIFVPFTLLILSFSIVCGRVFNPSNGNPSNPIVYIETDSNTIDNLERVTVLEAIIHPRHVTTNQRVDFKGSDIERRFQQVKHDDSDERGHLLASQFSGPPEWYNLTPQNVRVNRNLGYRSITLSWFEAECEVRKFLLEGGQRFVIWNVGMNYIGESHRPTSYHLKVQFWDSGRLDHAIDTTVRNPFGKEDTTFWMCKSCKSNRFDPTSPCQKHYPKKG